jgi:hypothetical protein
MKSFRYYTMAHCPLMHHKSKRPDPVRNKNRLKRYGIRTERVA